MRTPSQDRWPRCLHSACGIADLNRAVVAAVSIATAAETTLLEAVERGDRAAAVRLLTKGANPNAPGPDGTTAIMWAASNGDIDLVRALIKAGANVTLKNQFGTTAITEAAIIGSAPVIDALLKAGADPNTKNPEGETPLMAVARSGNVDAAKRLLEARADVNAKENFGGQTALMWAAAQGQAEMVKLLAASGADLNARGVIRQWERKVITEPRPKDMNKGGFTALLYAAREGCVECARHLVAAGADQGSRRPGADHAAQHGAAQSALRVRGVSWSRPAPTWTSGISSAGRRCTWRPTSARCR